MYTITKVNGMFGLEGNDLEEKKHQNIEEKAYKIQSHLIKESIIYLMDNTLLFSLSLKTDISLFSGLSIISI